MKAHFHNWNCASMSETKCCQGSNEGQLFMINATIRIDNNKLRNYSIKFNKLYLFQPNR